MTIATRRGACTAGAMLWAVLAAGAWAPAPAADLFGEIYNRSIVKQRSITSIRARFTETTTSTLLTRPIVAHGSVIAAPPGRVRMTYDDPEPKTMTLDGRTLIIVWPGRAEHEQIDIRAVQKRVDHYFRDASIAELRSMFDIAAQPDPVLRRTDRIDMTPTRKQIKAGLEKLELWIDRESDMLTQIRMTFPGGDQKTIALDKIVLNEPVNEDMFAPPGM